MKNIGFFVSRQHFVEGGGIGQFTKGFIEMCHEEGWSVDLLMDYWPHQNKLLDHIHSLKCARIVYPSSPLPYSEHRRSFVFTDALILERTVNYRNALLKGLEDNVYDLLVLNDLESLHGAHVTDIHEYIPSVFYTHHENSVFLENTSRNKVFNKAYTHQLNNVYQFPGIIIGTQSDYNVANITKHRPNANVRRLRMPIPERGLLTPPTENKEGLMFIGRYEVRKNPEEFLRVAKETGLKPMILTNGPGKRKFEQAIAAAGITDYEIKADIIGEEKVRFIQRARYAYHPSKLESFGFSAFETIHSCPTFAIKECEWWKHHEGFIIPVSRQDVVSAIKANREEAVPTEKLLRLFEDTKKEWSTLFRPPAKKSSLKKLNHELHSRDFISVFDYYFKVLERKNLAFEDVFTVLNNLDESVKIHYKDNKTYLSLHDTIEIEATPQLQWV